MTCIANRTSKMLLASAAALSLFALSNNAAAVTGDVLLSGTVAARCQVDVTATAAATTLDLDSDATDVTVANVVEDCNDPDGYTVSISTANGTTSGLFTASGIADTLAYSVKYGGNSATFAAGAAADVLSASSNTPAGGTSHALQISYTADTGMATGTYTDTLTVTIAVK